MEPQVRRAPRYVTSVGVEVVEHYESLHETRPMDWWQSGWTVDALGVRRDGSWAAFESALGVPRQSGKGAPTDAVELGGLFLLREELITHSAHQMKTCREAFRRIVNVVDANDDLRRRVKAVMRSKGEEGIELVDGRRLMFFSRSDGSGRGFSGNRNVLDEAQELGGEMMADIVPTLAAQGDACIMYTFTPPKRPGSYVAGLRRRAVDGVDDRTVYWGWENPRGTVLDVEALARVNPAYPHRITAERFEDMRRAIDDEELFARECGGIWPDEDDDGWLVVDRAAWRAARDAESVPLDPVAIGVDVLRDRSWAAIGAAGYRADGLPHVEVTGREGVADSAPGVTWVLPRLVEIVERQRPCVVVVNDKAVFEAAQAAGVEGLYLATQRDVAAWCGLLYDTVSGPDVEGRRLRHPGQDVLDAGARAGMKRPVGGAWAWAEGPVLTAVSLALGGLETPRLHRPAAGFFGAAWR